MKNRWAWGQYSNSSEDGNQSEDVEMGRSLLKLGVAVENVLGPDGLQLVANSTTYDAGLEAFLPIDVRDLRTFEKRQTHTHWYWKYNPTARDGEVGTMLSSSFEPTGVLFSILDHLTLHPS